MIELADIAHHDRGLANALRASLDFSEVATLAGRSFAMARSAMAALVAGAHPRVVTGTRQPKPLRQGQFVSEITRLVTSYRMAWAVRANHASIDRRNNRRCKLWSGTAIADIIELPATFTLDDRFPDGELPTFFDTPGFVAKKIFYAALRDFGVRNVEVFPAIIVDETRDRTIDDYVLINVIGMGAHPGAATPDIYLAEDDPQSIIVSARLRGLLAMFEDIYFEPRAG